MRALRMNFKGVSLALVLAMCASSVALASPFAERGPKEGRFHEMKRERMDRILGELNLTKDQLAKIEAARKTCEQERKQIHERLRAKKDELRLALDASETDMTRVNQLVQEISALSGERIEHRVKSILEIKSILTPEQFVKLREKKQALRKEWRGRKGERQ